MSPCADDLDILSWVWNFCLWYLRFLLFRRLHWRQRRHAFVSLPVEILAQVFMHLDIPSVFAVRLSCKGFCSVTKTRQFWYNHVNKLVKAYYVFPPEENLDEYTVGELERWVIRRSRSRDVFVNYSQPRFRERTLDLQSQGLSRIKSWKFTLLPGGRWLLISHPSVAMHFLDLDSPNPIPRLLFDPREIDDEIRKPKLVYFSIWIDRRAPRLSFRLAFVVFTKDISRIYINQIDLAGHGVDATLVASNIAVLRNFNLDMWPMGTALNDSYLVQSWCGHGLSTGRIGVYDYRQALGCLDYPMTESDERSIGVVLNESMEFIRKDTFAIQCAATRSLSIFQIGPSVSVNLLHRIPMHSRSCSMIRWTPEASIITMMDRAGRGEFQGLVLPHDPSRPPTIVVLGKCNKGKSCVYTLGTSVIVARENKIHEVFSHDWDFKSPISHELTLTSRFEMDFSANFLTFDEDTGRFLAYPCEKELVIYDIV